MNKIMAIICTVLLAMVAIGLIHVSCIIELAHGFYLFDLLASYVIGTLLACKVYDFYKWLRKDNQEV